MVPAFAVALALGLALVAALTWAAPALLGPSPHERIAGLEREARELGQRNRLAREIHDSVGHALSLVTVQAAAAQRVQETDPVFVAEALSAIEDAARSATAEFDHVLGLLRDEASSLSPAPGLTGLPDLVAAASRAGLGTTFENRLTDADQATLSPVAARELYRMAQEGLANAIRHGTGPCRVLIERDGREVRLEVTNTLRPPSSRRWREHGGGRGVPGLVDRARAVGGTASAGPTDDVWSVRVTLPWVGSR